MTINIKDKANKTAEIVSVASGRQKATLVLKNASYFNVFTGEVEVGDIAISNGKIAGIGSYEGIREINLEGKGICTPGLCDGHIHIESTQLTPVEFA